MNGLVIHFELPITNIILSHHVHAADGLILIKQSSNLLHRARTHRCLPGAKSIFCDCFRRSYTTGKVFAILAFSSSGTRRTTPAHATLATLTTEIPVGVSLQAFLDAVGSAEADRCELTIDLVSEEGK